MPGRRHRLPPGPQRSKPKRWYETAKGQSRLACDESLVATHYPTLAWHKNEDTGELSLEGIFVYDTQSGIRDEIKICVVFPAFYPEQEPRAYEAGNRFLHTLERHFYEDSYREGRCCLWLPPNSKWNADDSESLLVFLDELVMFFDRELIFDATGKWPGPQYDHGYNGYTEWIMEVLGGDQQVLAKLSPLLSSSMKVSRNELCPCGRTKYKRCHLHSVERIRREVGTKILEKLFA
jgi:hypothetical protein